MVVVYCVGEEGEIGALPLEQEVVEELIEILINAATVDSRVI